jgi:hypothetical protein
LTFENLCFFLIFLFLGPYLFAKYENITIVFLVIIEILYIFLYGKLRLLAKNKMSWVMFYFAWITLNSLVNYSGLTELDIEPSLYVSMAVSPFLTYFAYNTYTMRHPNRDKLFVLQGFVIMSLGLYSVWRSYEFSFLEGKATLSSLNTFFPVFFAMPLLFLSKSRLVEILSFVAAFTSAILCVKRSAAVIVVFDFAIWSLYYFVYIKSQLIKYLIISLFILILCFGYSKIIEFERLNYLLLRIESSYNDGGSGRTEIFASFIHKAKKMHWLEIIGGRGFAASQNDCKNAYTSFHNDWSEVFYSTGILGLICLCAFFSRLLRITYYLLRQNDELFMSSLLCLVLFSFYSILGSMFRYTQLSILLFGYLGIIEAKLQSCSLKLVWLNRSGSM